MADPSEVHDLRERGDQLAVVVGGRDAVRWGICVVYSVIANPSDGDAVREAYGELVDRYRNDEAAMALLRPVGEQIRKLEAEGKLPSVMVARSDRRKR